MLVLDRDEVKQALLMSEAIAAMRHAFAMYSAGRVPMPLRTRICQTGGSGTFLVMPAISSEGNEAFAVKVVSIIPQNPGAGLPLVRAALLLMDGTDGSPAALMEGTSLTALRTGAASGLATDLLARKDSRVLAMIGAGAQAETQVAGVCTVREIDEVRVYARDPAHVRKFIDSISGCQGIPERLIAVPDPREAVEGADIICTATTSAVPVFDDRDVSPGTHINGIGSYLPLMQELPGDTVRRAKVVVDSREAALAEAGDLLVPITKGWIGTGHIHAELGEIINEEKPGRAGSEEITIFKSVGIAAQDACAAAAIYKNAVSRGIGRQIAL
jgi:ornithine cyclodeaminase